MRVSNPTEEGRIEAGEGTAHRGHVTSAASHMISLRLFSRENPSPPSLPILV
ncbi:uncharacterized protein BDR25DRAFT_357733 [Lindgomyces ingoldianus]|uniref:Uncharacterized protein n=1 Tax=Lindgomyces ingoldianus TaxID=673940 RepID=A0ACB6QQF4_9PLEO|nr:uncharacterized protein BDR25DRAFT_357733 [Lindgomyces ingoldianus]KAF2468396.1 hypothetical protein BDR25DRAFT_357733 [Lindgomyces ingoldianus]